MAEVRTRDEALDIVDRALNQWLTVTSGVLEQAAGPVDGARSAAETQVRKWAARASAFEALLKAANNPEDARRLQLELNSTRGALQQAQRATATIHELARRLAALQRAHAKSSAEIVHAARADIARRIRELGAYRTTDGGGATADWAGDSGISGGPSSALTKLGLEMVDIEAVGFENNPIVDSFDKKGMTRADYRWAVQTWADVVGPGVGRGMTRDDFERRDAERGSVPLRRTADIYDWFVGGDRIVVDRWPDGTLNVINGRHRVEIARELGIRNMPMETH